MKKVLFEKQPKDTINYDEITDNTVVVGRIKNDDHDYVVIRREEDGWITRYINSEAGCSGHYPTKKQCILSDREYCDFYVIGDDYD